MWRWVPVLLMCLLAQSAFAKVLRVGLVPIAPFVVLKGGTRGIAVDLWDKIALDNGLSYKYITISENIDEETKKLQTGELDLIMGPVGFTFNRKPYFEMSSPYFLSHMALLVGQRPLHFWANLGMIARHVLSLTPLVALIVLFSIVHVIWYWEKGKKAAVPTSYWAGINYIFWRHLLELMHDVPETHVVRILTLCWYVVKGVVASSLMAVIISAITMSYAGSLDTITQDDVLSKKRIACIRNGPVQSELSRMGIKCQPVPSFEAAVELVGAKKVDGFAALGAPIAYYLRTHKTPGLHMSNIVLKNDALAFALPLHSPYRDIIDNGLAHLRENGFASEVCSLYLTENPAKNCVF